MTVTSVLAQQAAPVGAPAAPPIVPRGASPAVPATIDPPINIAPPVPGVPLVLPDAPLTPNAPGVPGAPVVPGAPGATAPGPNAPRIIEFQGDELGLVLRSLARQANVDIMVTEKAAAPGTTVTARFSGKTPLQAIELIVDSKGLVMEDKAGVLQVKTQEEKAKEPTISGSYTLSYAQAKDVLPLLQTQLLAGVPAQFDQRTNTVFFRESKSNMEKIMEFLKVIDLPTQQVMIEARLVEVTANPQQAYGINWSGVVGSASSPQTIKYGGSSLNGPPTITRDATTGAIIATPTTFPSVGIDSATGKLKSNDFILDGHTAGNFASALGGQFAILSIPQMSATLRLLNEDADAEFLANPRVVTANHLKAEIKIIRQQPVPQLNFNEQTAQAVFSGFTDKEFGNTLEVTPSINKDDFVSLNVKPEISNKVGDQTFSFGGAVVSSPIIDKRTLNSNVVVKSGDTLAIGGLLQDETTKRRTKVPVLGDIPLIGYAFQERINGRNKRNLLVFVTPTIIKQGYGTGLEDQVAGLHHSGEEFADPNGWRNNAKGAYRVVPTANRTTAADVPKPGVAPNPKKIGYKVSAEARP